MSKNNIWSFNEKYLSEHPLPNNSKISLKNLRDELRNSTKKALIPGCVIVLAEKGEIKWAEAFGSRQIQPTQEKMTLDTIFDLASLTKVVATLPAILHLIDQGILSLQSCLKEFYPESEDGPLGNVTIAQLLTHTSGLSARTYLKQYGESKNEMIKGILQSPLENANGSMVSYSNRGFILLGEIVEKISGESLYDYVQKHIWNKIDMHETMFTPHNQDYLLRVAPTEFREEIQACLKGTVHDENASILGGIAGHAGVFSTANDLVQFCNMIMSKGFYKGQKILNEQLIANSMINHTSHLNEPRGLGWDFFSTDVRENAIIGHLGFTGTSLWFDPLKEIYCIFLTNRIHPSREALFIRSIRSSILNTVF
ncbi:serine hydrolase domain-containing protein [Solibacillus sp. CAU 1738]|uniref:serine hydrolase domain-containing protein n=1 Tax=Solibacillus sp. CAU 1738 TaxID=3140363 RepID=UPI0032618486